MRKCLTKSQPISQCCVQYIGLDQLVVMSGNDGKWMCSRCTYHNYRRARKCTMCSALRQSIQLIINDDNYKMSSLVDSMTDKNNDKYETKNETNRKWWCDVCTYLNDNKCHKCVQCLSGRKARNTSPKPDATCDEVSNVLSDTSVSCEPTGVANTNTICVDSYSLDKNKPNKYESIGVESGFKWSCIACTYDNWNASKKCVLCLTAKKMDTNCQMDRQVAITSSADDTHDQKRTDSPIATMAAKESSNVDYNNIINNKINDNFSDISLRDEDIRGQQCEQLYDLDLVIGQSSRPVAKRVPSDVSRYLGAEIRRLFASGLKQRKGEFGCYFVTEFATFALPQEIEDLSPAIQERLFDEYLDRDVQKELEEETPIINWSLELTERLGSRLYALWNRSTGDCLLDSVLQATFGIFDRENSMRKALGDSLNEGSSLLFPRFKEAETLQANLLHFTLDDDQWREDWAVILSLASQPGQSLEQIHIFTLAHILRRPIIVYAIKIVKSFRGDSLGYAGYEGIYLPLLWESSFCWKSPIALGYTRGHFSALVPMEPVPTDDQIGAGANFRSNDDNEVIYLPLVTSEHQLLPLHFLGHNELGREEDIIRQWLDCCVTTGGILAAKQKIPRKPLLVAQMMDEWLDFYRNLPQPSISATDRMSIKTNDFSSDDSDQEI